MTRRRGATLIELVVVLLITGIVLGVAGLAPRMAAPPQDAVLRTITEALQEGRHLALTSGAPVTVIVDAADGRLWIRRANGEERLVTWPRVSDAQVVTAASRAQVRFEANGMASGDVIDVQSPAGTTRLTVDRATGDLRTDAPH